MFNTSYHSIPQATMMWSKWLMKMSQKLFFRHFTRNNSLIPTLYTQRKFLLGGNKVVTIVRPQDPFRAINLSIPITQGFMSIDGTTLMCKARVFRYARTKPQRFSLKMGRTSLISMRKTIGG